eukprot:8931760-Ditylum_brightwellii.AAC.1
MKPLIIWCARNDTLGSHLIEGSDKRTAPHEGPALRLVPVNNPTIKTHWIKHKVMKENTWDEIDWQAITRAHKGQIFD